MCVRNFLFDSELYVTPLSLLLRGSSCTWISFTFRCQTWKDSWCLSSAEPLRTAASPLLQQRYKFISLPQYGGGGRERSSGFIWSVLQLVKMFGFILDRPVIQDQLRPHLIRLVEMILVELEQTELLFHSQREKSETFSKFTPTAAARLRWAQQLRLRAEEALSSYNTVQHL